ncbi:MAG: hypothetical protein IJ809_03105 [Clostridia bacterium]|nr:hypothetical protein [Clostridia bacterium]
MDFMKNTLNDMRVRENTLYDFVYNLFFYASLKESEDDIKNGRVYTLEELEEEMEGIYESYNNRKSKA